LKPRVPLGRMLIDAGYIDEFQFRSATGHQRRYGGKFASLVYTLGFVREQPLLVMLCRQLGYPGVELRRSVLKVANANLIPRELAERHQVLPAYVERDKIWVVMSDPADMKATDEIAFVTGKRVVPYLGLAVLVQEMIQKLYNAKSLGKANLIMGEEADPSLASDQGHLEIVTAQTTPQPPTPRSSTLEVEGVRSTEPPLPSGLAPRTEHFSTDEGSWGTLDSRVAPPPSPPAATPPAAPQVRSPSSTPISAPATAQVATDARAGAPLILVVDDDTSFSSAAKAILSDRGYRAATSAGGIPALQFLREYSPDLVVLELMLHDIHGLEICQKLRLSKRFGQTPLLVLLATPRGDGFRRDLQTLFRIETVLEKPFPVELLARRVEEALVRAGRIEARLDAARARAQQSLAVGGKQLGEGRIDEAIETFRQGLADDPLSAELHYHLGGAFRRKALDLQALVELERAVELRPDYYPALQSLALLYQEKGFRRKSFEMWDRALEYCPEETLRQKLREHLISYYKTPTTTA
jgi:DNA-binding response OmpR family regulator